MITSTFAFPQRRFPRTVLSHAIFLGLCGTLPAAASTQYHYHGHDSTYPNINCDLYLTGGGSTYDATGTIYIANFLANVKGTLTGGTLTGNLTYRGPSTLAAAPVAGSLSGAPGTGTLTLSTGYVDINGALLQLNFVLDPVAAPVPPPPPPQHTLVMPANTRLTGQASFGYTVVTLTLDLTLRGSSYVVNGFLTVNQVRPTVLRVNLPVSGILTPGTQGILTISGTPPGSNPRFTGTLQPYAVHFDGQITGIPALLITNLFIGAS